MPIILGIVGAIGAFFTGAYIGTVVDNANAAPSVQINTENAAIDEKKKLTNKDLMIAGALGVGAWYVYKKYLK